MATNADSVVLPASPQPAKSNFVTERLPFVIATGGEFIGLFFWLAYWDAGSYLLATIVLWAGFITERVVVLCWVGHFQGQMEAKYPGVSVDKSEKDFKNKPKAQQLAHLGLICLSEITGSAAAARRSGVAQRRRGRRAIAAGTVDRARAFAVRARVGVAIDDVARAVAGSIWESR